jgi:SSS family solute:Na+ symporter
VSAADAVLFMLTTSLSQDLYKRFVNPAADDDRVLMVARLATVVSGALGVGLALFSEDLVQTLSIFYALLGVSLFVPVVAGLYVRRANTESALAAIVGGVGGMLIVQRATGGAGFGWLGPAPAGLFCAALGWAISLTFTPKAAVADR